jgi:hypothetical protein
VIPVPQTIEEEFMTMSLETDDSLRRLNMVTYWRSMTPRERDNIIAAVNGIAEVLEADDS